MYSVNDSLLARAEQKKGKRFKSSASLSRPEVEKKRNRRTLGDKVMKVNIKV